MANAYHFDDPMLHAIQKGRCKVYIVEIDDLDRERVLSFETDGVTINSKPDFTEVDTLLDSAKIFKNQDLFTISEMRLVQREDGTFYSVENFFSAFQDEE